MTTKMKCVNKHNANNKTISDDGSSQRKNSSEKTASKKLKPLEYYRTKIKNQCKEKIGREKLRIEIVKAYTPDKRENERREKQIVRHAVMRDKISRRYSDFDISEFKFAKTLDKGGFGEVFEALHEKSNTTVAIKKVRIDPAIVEDFQSNRYTLHCSYLLRELKIMKKCRGNQFAKFYGACWEGLGTVYFILELLTRGSLYTLWRFQVPFFEDEVQFFAANILLGLEKMHAKRIVHKDMKLKNVMIGEDGYPRIIDFGLSRMKKKGEKLTEGSGSGTPSYNSPEEVKCRQYGVEVDLWSFGVMLFEMLAGKSPFSRKFENESGEKWLEESINNCWFKVPSSVSPEAKDLIESLLQFYPEDRIRIRQCKKHPFFKGVNFTKLETKETKPPFFVTNF